MIRLAIEDPVIIGELVQVKKRVKDVLVTERLSDAEMIQLTRLVQRIDQTVETVLLVQGKYEAVTHVPLHPVANHFEQLSALLSVFLFAQNVQVEVAVLARVEGTRCLWHPLEHFIECPVDVLDALLRIKCVPFR